MRGKGLELACLIQAQVPTGLRGDPGRLRQILSNLLGNAVKFTERGKVAVRIEVDEKPDGQDPIDAGRPAALGPVTGKTGHFVSVRFSVADTGIGIAPEARTRIFQPFVQADGSTTRKYGGTGLGLAICEQLVDLMGGFIGVDSEPGCGSVFQFTVPLERKVE
jgi:signal transduction histidine kinase